MKDKIVKYLEGIRDYSLKYHNHKETAAWAGLAFYAVFCGTFTRTKFTGEYAYCLNIGFTILILLVALLLYFYIKNQFDLKDVATSYFSASMSLLLEVLLKEEKDIKPNEYLALDNDSGDTELASTHFLPQKVLETAKTMKTKGAGAARKTKRLAYIILITVTVGTVVFQWFGTSKP